MSRVFDDQWSVQDTTLTGSTMADWDYIDIQVDIVKSKREQIKDIIGDDMYLLQEIVTELRKEKMDKILNDK